MNLNFPKLARFFRNLKAYFSKLGSEADSDWRLLFNITIIVLLCSLGWNLYIFLMVSKNTKFDENVLQNKNEALIDQKSLSEILERYKEREKSFEEAKVNKPQIFDPSV